MDGKEIAEPQDLTEIMNAHKAGDEITLTIFRGRRKLDIKVKLGDATDQQQSREG